jgi:hypothetical protein
MSICLYFKTQSLQFLDLFREINTQKSFLSYYNIRPYSCVPPLDLPSHILIIVIDWENSDYEKALIRMSTFTDSARKNGLETKDG